jgi:hypothetical protein
MAGLSGSQAYFGIAKNVNNAKGGAVPTTPRWRNPFTGGSAGPERVVERLQETDTTRDPGSAYLVRGGAAGSPEFYVRPDSFPAYAAAAFGNLVTSGAGPYVHTIDTTAATLPYVAFFKMLGGTIFERYEDCMVSSLTVRAEAGQPLSAAMSFMGLSVTRSDAEWTTPGTYDVAEPWYFHEATIAIGGSTVTNVRSFELTLENNVQQQQTDSIALYDVVPGRRELSGSFDMIFDSTDAFNAYKTHHYGTTSGTTQPNTLQTQSLSFTFAKGTDTVQFTVNKAAYEEFPADPDAGGDPVISSVRFAGIRPDSGAFATCIVNNDIVNTTGADYPA